MQNAPNISANVGEVPPTRLSLSRRKKIKEFVEINKKLKKKKVTAGDIIKKVNGNIVRRPDLED